MWRREKTKIHTFKHTYTLSCTNVTLIVRHRSTPDKINANFTFFHQRPICFSHHPRFSATRQLYSVQVSSVGLCSERRIGEGSLSTHTRGEQFASAIKTYELNAHSHGENEKKREMKYVSTKRLLCSCSSSCHPHSHIYFNSLP